MPTTDELWAAMVARVEAERFGHRGETREEYVRRLALERPDRKRNN